ncbi:S-layer homology domain-containing protein [Paenibacillus sp. ISL-20]|uniref:S-layer homology domain-containing protein n=1 Tax=Paenibacillus sp. ISL-20 TaxID=2819163 RepID=UPI001BE9E335|nr:S-layer homology domain-containing protein [Paenibacillus sp. ISL-20]MBT2762513.1 S-layer homology domain-containing protein [Paenibacillus sp. ISL-20]
MNSRKGYKFMMVLLCSVLLLPLNAFAAVPDYENRSEISQLIGKVTDMKSGDFNDDGHLDIAAVTDGMMVYLLYGQGDGTFRPPQSQSILGVPYSLEVGDFDRDGNLDLLIGTQVGVFLWYGEGNGTFPDTRMISLMLSQDVTIADFDLDGMTDIAILNFNNVTVVHVAADRSFTMVPFNLSHGGNKATTITNGAIGTVDLVVASPMLGLQRVKGNDYVRSEVFHLRPGNTVDLISTDMNGDGHNDIIALNDMLGVFFYMNLGDNTYNLQQHPLPMGGQKVYAEDVNGDGKSEIIVATGKGIELHSKEDAAGNLSLQWQAELEPQGGGTHRALVGDYNEDGTLDLIVSSNQTLYIYKAVTMQPQPGTLRLEAAGYAISENDSPLRVKVLREGGSHGAVALHYATADGTAKAGKHYTPASGTLTFTDGEIEKWIELQILDDDIYEDDRELYLNITAVPGTVVGTPTQAVITITEDDPQPDTEVPLWPTDAELLASGITINSVKLTWPEAMDNDAVSEYRIFDGNKATPAATVTGTTYSYEMDGLMANTSYTLSVRAYDQAGNVSSPLQTTVQTLDDPNPGPDPDPERDQEAPVWSSLGELTISDIGTTAMSLFWPEASDNYEVSGYRVYRGETADTPIATVTSSTYSYTAAGLSPNTIYTFRVKAYDLAGNESIPLQATAKTLSLPTPPNPSPGGERDPGPTNPSTTRIPSDNAKLQTFSIGIGESGKVLKLSPDFSPDVYVYRAETEASEIRFELTTAHNKARINGPWDKDGRISLKPGENVMEIKVTAENGKVCTYTLTVVRSLPHPEPPIKPEPPQAQKVFRDTAGHWAQAAIDEAVSRGLVKGYANGTFKPNSMIRRDEFTVMLVRGLGLQSDGSKHAFTDESDIPAWSREAVGLAAQEGIIQGNQDGRFHPGSEITRAELTVMLAKALGLNPLQGDRAKFADEASIPAWAKGYIAAAYAEGLVSGRGDGKFEPDAPATRAEAVVMLRRMLNK